jgi:hypothetical protein
MAHLSDDETVAKMGHPNLDVGLPALVFLLIYNFREDSLSAMGLVEVLQVGAAIIVSLGGGGAIVLGLSSYLGKLWADRALEKEKHKYAEILQTAKSELDKAANRYQVELDSLALVHKLRTTEEFSHLGRLWRHLAILQNAFRGAAGLGLMIVPADAIERQRHKDALRSEYEKALWKARKFFLEQKLFIPTKIAECAEQTLGAAIKEKNFYDLFFKHHDATARSQYSQNLAEFVADFEAGMTRLESLKREHIEGTKAVLRTGLPE